MLQVDKIVAVLEDEKNLVADLLVKFPQHANKISCEKVGHCAIGALYHAAGVDDLKLKDFHGSADEMTEDEIAILRKHYGIERYHADRIISANDSVVSMETRREQVIAMVRRLAERQIRYPEEDQREVREYDMVNGVYRDDWDI